MVLSLAIGLGTCSDLFLIFVLDRVFLGHHSDRRVTSADCPLLLLYSYG